MGKLNLSINPEGWRLFMTRKTDSVFRRLKERILERDHHTCHFCGFQAKEYQEVINLDQNYRNNRLSNMTTTCCFCTQGFFLENVGIGDFGGGKLIYLPEMTQEELNAFCHVLFCAMSNGTDYHDSAQNIYRSFKFRTQSVEDKFGLGTSTPYLFAEMLLESQKESTEKLIQETLKDLRLLPSYPKFKKQLDAWAEAAAKELEESSKGAA